MNLAFFEAQLHSNVVSVATQALEAGVGLVVCQDGDDHVGAVAVLASPGGDRPALAGELLTDLSAGFWHGGVRPICCASVGADALVCLLLCELWSQLFPFGNLFMEIFISIGERLREEREAMGKTQSDFADFAAAAGVPGATRQSQAKYEKGLASPSAAYLSAIALEGVDVRYVLTGERDGPPPVALSGEEKLLVDYYRDAPPAIRKAAMATLLSASPGAVVGGDFSQHAQGDGSIQIGGYRGNVKIKKK